MRFVFFIFLSVPRLSVTTSSMILKLQWMFFVYNLFSLVFYTVWKERTRWRTLFHFGFFFARHAISSIDCWPNRLMDFFLADTRTVIPGRFGRNGFSYGCLEIYQFHQSRCFKTTFRFPPVQVLYRFSQCKIPLNYSQIFINSFFVWAIQNVYKLILLKI